MALLTSENLKTFCWELQLWYELKPFWSLGHVTRPGDLTWCDQDKKKILTDAKLIHVKQCKIWLCCSFSFSSYCRKTTEGGGGGKMIPPIRAKVERELTGTRELHTNKFNPCWLQSNGKVRQGCCKRPSDQKQPDIVTPVWLSPW